MGIGKQMIQGIADALSLGKLLKGKAFFVQLEAIGSKASRGFAFREVNYLS